MRVNKWHIAAVLSVLFASCNWRSVHAAPAIPGGLTITPATFTLELKKGEQTAAQRFTVINNYNTAVTLHFAFQASTHNVAVAAGRDPATQLKLTNPDITLDPHTSVTQTATLTDSGRLAPGSQLVDLTVSQVSTATQTISTVPSIRMPLVIIKDDGAVASMAAGKLQLHGLHMSMPGTLEVTVKNTGNTISVPHGTLIIADAEGKEVGKGVLNAGGQAIAPDARLTFAVAITNVAPSTLLGNYHATLLYGFGGGQPTQAVSAHFFYIGWRHIAVTVSVAVLLYFGLRLVLHIHAKPLPKPKHRKQALANRGSP